MDGSKTEVEACERPAPPGGLFDVLPSEKDACSVQRLRPSRAAFVGRLRHIRRDKASSYAANLKAAPDGPFVAQNIPTCIAAWLIFGFFFPPEERMG